MEERFDEETKSALINALEGFMADTQKMQENREKRLWKMKVNLPCSLLDAIKGLSKVEIDGIRRNYDFRNISTLNKAELATKLAELVPSNLSQVIYTLDQGRYDLIKEIIYNPDAISDMELSVSQVEALRKDSIVFSGLHDDRKILFVPEELKNVFSQIDGRALEEIIQRNTEWIRLTYGLLYYFGVMDTSIIKKMVSEHTGRDVDLLEYINVVSSAFDFYEQGRFTQYGFQDDRVYNAKRIIEEHRRRPNLDYYPFTKKQLLKAGDPDYVDKTPEMNSFINFLFDHYELSDGDAKEIALQVTNMINRDAMPSSIIKYLQNWLEFPSLEFVQLLTAKIIDLHNNTRQWVLKGHTPNELSREERKHLTPLPSKPLNLVQPKSNRANSPTRTKIGRNEPCPCGSGKKYKRCCGK